MSKEEQPFENHESVTEQTPRPKLLDVVRIDGRWAQVGGIDDLITYLDDQSVARINWDEFRLVKNWGELPVWKVKELTDFTLGELKRVHWGSEQEQFSDLREEVSVFGEFEKIKNR